MAQWRITLQAARKDNTSNSCARPQKTWETGSNSETAPLSMYAPGECLPRTAPCRLKSLPTVCLIISRSDCLHFSEFHCKTSHHQSSIPCRALLNAACSGWPSVPHEHTSKKTASAMQKVTLSAGKRCPTFAASQDRPTRELPPR